MSMRYDPAENEGGIKIYLKEIGQIPLLTRQDEVDLSILIKKGDKKAREKMIKANLRLVVKIAHDYSGYGLPLLDLISEGNIGLMKAVERFDPNKGGKLSTYGSWWIKQSMKRALANQSKTIRLPCHLVDKIGKMRRASTKLSEELGRDPTHAEIAKAMGISVADVVHLHTVSIRPASLDAPIGEDEGTEFGEVIGDKDAPDPFEMLKEKSSKANIVALLSRLPEREQLILNQRFGLDGGKKQNLEEIGDKLHLTRERIRQIQNIALRKLRKMMEQQEKPKKQQIVTRTGSDFHPGSIPVYNLPRPIPPN